MTGKPVFISTGVARLSDIEAALTVCKEAENENIILLKCLSEYPTPFEDINLKVIPSMIDIFECLVGLSDHSMGTSIPLASVPLGVKVVEKHLTLSRGDGGVDAAFSLEPDEFKYMVENIRIVEMALGKVTYELTPKQIKNREHSRSLFVTKNMKKGDVFTDENLRSIRPGYGLHTGYYKDLIGKKVNRDVQAGAPMAWDIVDFSN